VVRSSTLDHLESKILSQQAKIVEMTASIDAYRDLNDKLTEAIQNDPVGSSEPRGKAIGLPPVLLNTLPKSGSVYISSKLSTALSVGMLRISQSSFPNDMVNLPHLQVFAKGGRISQEHLDATPFNVSRLAKYLDRWILHIRDPRQTVLSFTHHLNRHKKENSSLAEELFTLDLSEGYFDKSFEQQLDEQLNLFFAASVDWIKKWLEVYDSGRYDILLTTYDQLIADETILFKNIFDFMEIPTSTINHVELDKTMDVHFRSGDPNEWREVFTEDQIKRATKLIPKEWKERFGWH